jgi:hypothetical protein
MFRVVWQPRALNDLTEAWLEATSAERRAITEASRQFDIRLKDNPEKQGESRGNNERVVFIRPLGVRIEIDHEQSVVWVLHAWRLRRRK